VKRIYNNSEAKQQTLISLLIYHFIDKNISQLGVK